MSDYEIRRLGEVDLPEMRDALKMFGRAFGEADIYDGSPPSDRYLVELLQRRSFIMLAAINAERVVGGLAAYALQKFEQDRREIYIYDLAVAEGHRRKGIGTALIETLRSIAVDEGAYAIFVQADYGDDLAIAL